MPSSVSRRTCLLAFTLATATLDPADAVAQNGSASIAVTVRDTAGRPLAGALVYLIGANAARKLDSLGRGRFDSLTAGVHHVRVALIGYDRRDSTFALIDGQQANWNVELKDTWHAQQAVWDSARAQAERANVGIGHVDSIARGYLKRDTTRGFDFRRFGQILFLDAMRENLADSSTVLSPASAGLALSIVYAGARNSTARAIASTLGLGSLQPDEFAERNRSLVDDVRNRSDVTLEIANAIWIDASEKIGAPFRRTVEESYLASVHSLVLKNARAMRVINDWGDSVTHGKIPKFLADSLPDTTLLFIANAVYFKGKWLDQFDKSATRDRDFTLSSGRRVRMKGMERTAVYGYRRAEGYQLLRIPYRTGKVAMYVVLPDRGVAVDSLAKRMEGQGWPSSLGGNESRQTHLVLPRFHVELGTDLVPLLVRAGMGIAMDCDKADFRAMIEPSDGGWPPLCIGSAQQKVYVDVDEEGTEAAAMTGITIVITTAGGYPPPPDFIVDRPFIFIIRDEVSGLDLFVGRIAKP